MNQRKRKIVYGTLVILYIILIFALTFQSLKDTVALSDRVVKAVSNTGYKVAQKNLRSLVHIPMYFGLGVLLTLFVKNRGWKWYWAIVAGCTMGLVDETVKIFLPGREFDLGDLGRDVVGVVLGVGIVMGIMAIGKKLKSRKHRELG